MGRLFDDYRRVGQGLPFRAIASFETMRGAGIAEEFTQLGMSLDLLIVDEAHHMRNEETRTYRLGSTLVNAADAVLFLTATPLHLRNRDLFNLLNLLAPDEFDNPDAFDEHVRPNEIISRTSKLVAAGKYADASHNLRSVEWTLLKNRFQDNPIYTETVRRLNEYSRNAASVTTEQRVAIQWDLTELNTLSNIVSRTRKREVATGAVRAPYSLRIALTPAERAFYNAVLNQTRQELQHARPGALGFASIMKERQAASCLAAMRERLEDASKHSGRFRADVDVSSFEIHEGESESQQSNTPSLLHASQAIGEVDSKFAKFESIVTQTLADDPASKILVFSFFKGTLRYLYQRLKRLGVGVATIHGDVPVADRRRIIDDFANGSTVRVLLSSEVGAEGLDFQFCDVLINYDLPWNPMQVEQRIGCLDRFGQKHQRIRIFNFFIDDTIETRIFERLYERIKIFERSIGDLESILGEEIAKISREALQGKLTPREESKLADQAAMRIVRHQREEDELELHKDEFLGQGEILDQKIKHTISSGRYISDNEVRALVGTFVRAVFPRARLEFDPEEPCATLEIDSSLASHLGSYIERNRLAHRLSDRFRTAMSERRRVALTFDSELARQRPLLEFITIRHPLADAAAAYWKKQLKMGIPASEVEITGPSHEIGAGHFFIYLLEVGGVSTSTTLQPVIVRSDGSLAPESAINLLNAIQFSAPNSPDLPKRFDTFVEAERIAAQWIASQRNLIESDVRRRNKSLLASRQASIQASFSAKIRRVDTLLNNATDERIRRMRRSELHNLRAKQDAKLAELQSRRDVSVSSLLIAGGSVRIAAAIGTV